MIETKVMTRKRMMEALTAKGVHVAGTTREFGIGGDGIWISGESTTDLFDYWSSGVDPELEKFVNDNGWYFEWYDPGTMMVWEA
jgi:hypothetical protein